MPVHRELHGTPDMPEIQHKLLKYLERRFRSESREETSRRMAEWCLNAANYIERRQSAPFVKDFEDWMAAFKKKAD